MSKDITTTIASDDNSLKTAADAPADQQEAKQNGQPGTASVDTGGPEIIEKPNRAWKHGVYAKAVILPNESTEGFEALLEDLRKHHDPVGELEEQFVADMADAIWRKRRLVQQYSEACFRNDTAEKKVDNEIGLKLNYKQSAQFRDLTRRLIESDGTDIWTSNTPGPGLEAFTTLLKELAAPQDADESAFDQIARPGDLERYLKLTNQLDKIIEKKLAALAHSKLYRKEFTPRLLQAQAPCGGGGKPVDELSSPGEGPSTTLN